MIQSTFALLCPAFFAYNTPNSLYKLSALHNQTVIVLFDDPYVFGNGSCCDNVVACHHPHFYTCSVAFLDGRVDLFPWDVPDSQNAQHHELVFLYLVYPFIIFLLQIVIVIQRFIGQAESSKGRLCHFMNRFLYLLFDSGGKNLRSVGRRIKPLVATVQDHLRCSLHKYVSLRIAPLDYHGHSLPGGTEGNLLQR